MRATLVSLAVLALASSLLGADKAAPDKKKPTHLFIKSGTLLSGSGAPIQVRSFQTSIADGHAPGKPTDHEEKVVTILSGTAFLSNQSLSKLLNEKLAGKNLEDIQVSCDKGKVKITGKAKKAIAVPFTIEGPVSLTPQGFIHLKTEEKKVGKLPGLADLLGLNPDKIAGDGSVKGIKAEKDAIDFDPDLLWGLPVHGRVTRLALQQNGLLLVFGGATPKEGTHVAASARVNGKAGK